MSKFDNPQLEAIEPELLAEFLEAIEPVAFPADRRDALRAEAIAHATRREGAVILHADEGGWRTLVPGISVKPLRVDRIGRTQTSLWRMEPGARIPPHTHTDEEECLVLEGELIYDDRTYRAGDFLLAPVGLHHTEFETKTGAMLMIRSELPPHLERLFAGIATT